MRIGIRQKFIIPLTVITLACFGIMFAIFFTTVQRYEASGIANARTLLLDGYKKELRSATEIAASLIAEIFKTPGLSYEQKLDLARRMVRPLRFGTEGYYYAYHAGDGVNLIHGSTQSNEGKSLWNMQSPDKTQYIIRDLDAAAKAKAMFVEFYWSKPGGKDTEVYPKLGTALAVPGTDIWVGTGAYIDSINKDMETTADSFRAIARRTNFILLAFFLVFTAVFVAVITMRVTRIVRPLEELSRFLTETGGVDFSSRPDVKYGRARDEIGDLYRSVNGLFDRFTDVLKSAQNTVQRSRDVGGTLQDASLVITGALDETGRVVQGLREGAVRLDLEANRNFSVGKELEAFIADANSLVASQSVQVGEASKAIEVMSASIGSIAEEAVNHTETVRSMDEAARNGGRDIEQTAKLLAKAYENAAAIGEVISLIDGIASRTNLLAMNAAIEAAHAGASGKGFAVVAQEIRKLAEGAAGNAREISGRLKDVAASIQESSASAAKARGSFGKIVAHSEAVSTAVLRMKTAASELAESQRRIGATLAELIAVSERVAESSRAAGGKTDGLSGSMQGLTVMSGDTKQGIEKMEEVLREIRAKSEAVKAASERNATETEALADLVLRFKV